MNPIRLLILSALTIGAAFGSIAAQSRIPRTALPADVQFYEPRNKLEEFDTRLETVLVKGNTNVGTISGRNGSVRVQAIEIQDTGKSTRASGVEITINQTAQPAAQVESLIDYEEIDSLISGLDTVAKASDSITKLAHFQARYRNKEEFEIVVFKQTAPGIAVTISNSLVQRARIQLTLDDLAKLRWMILEAKARLDEIK
jgi:hypothetical protein